MKHFTRQEWEHKKQVTPSYIGLKCAGNAPNAKIKFIRLTISVWLNIMNIEKGRYR